MDTESGLNSQLSPKGINNLGQYQRPPETAVALEMNTYTDKI